MDDLKAKRKRLECSISLLCKAADEFAQEAETTGKVALISKSNAMRRSAKDKQCEVDAVSKQLVENLLAIKNG